MRWPRPLRRRERAADDAEAEQDVLERQRARMVAEQLEARGIRDEELLHAFRTVERLRDVHTAALPPSMHQPHCHSWHGAHR